MADGEGIEPPPAFAGLVFETSATNQHLPTIRKFQPCAGMTSAVAGSGYLNDEPRRQIWRMRGDSNPRADFRRPHAFQACAIVHSATHPNNGIFNPVRILSNFKATAFVCGLLSWYSVELNNLLFILTIVLSIKYARYSNIGTRCKTG